MNTRTTKSTKGATPSSAQALAASASAAVTLLGSSLLPSLIEIGGEQVQLGTVVAAAHAASGLTVQAWNELPEFEREKLLGAQVDAMLQKAADEAEAARVAEAERQAQAEREAEAEREANAEREAAEAARKREEDEANAKSEKEAGKYPRRVLATNHSGISLVEPISGAHIQAAGKAPIYLADAEQEHNVMQNLHALLAQNNQPDTALEFEDLPD